MAGPATELGRCGRLPFVSHTKIRCSPASQSRTLARKSSNRVQSPRGPDNYPASNYEALEARNPDRGVVTRCCLAAHRRLDRSKLLGSTLRLQQQGIQAVDPGRSQVSRSYIRDPVRLSVSW